MAILKMKKIREMGGKEMDEKLAELKLELSKERAASDIGTAKSPGKIKELRKAIARILTAKGGVMMKQDKKKEGDLK